jgi:7,8-dihydroneopterin aldolase/epimerase/oxygenase
MMDTLQLTGLLLHAYHGVLPEEQRLGQRFELDIVIEADLAQAGASDDIADTINYGVVAQIVTTTFTQTRFKLLEAAAHAVAMAVLDAKPLAQAVRITIRKPSAPIAAIFSHAAITIERRRANA